MKRPTGITVLGILMAFLAFAGLGNGIAVPGMPFFLRLLALSYGITAFTTSVGLFRMAKWTRKSFLTWCATVIGTAIGLRFEQGHHLIPFVGFTLFVVAILYLGNAYIRRQIA